MRQVGLVNADGSQPRFCWPAEDRVRARIPFQAPRISPVFPASVFLRPHPRGFPYMQVSPDWRVMGEQDACELQGDESHPPGCRQQT
jgi:hypothetical protein